MYIVFLVVMLLVFGLYPVVAALIDKKRNEKKDAVIVEQISSKDFLKTILFQWGGVAAVFIMCLIGGISLSGIGLRLLNFQYNTWLTIITLVLYGLGCVFFLYQTILPFISAKQREEAKKLLADETKAGIVKVLPRTKKERLVFSLVALTAGICEEILFRGFTVFLLQAIFPGIPVYLVILIPCVFFGLAQFYQGVQGVIHTGIMGLILMCVFVVSGTLIPGMILHFLVDFSSTFLLWEKQPA